MQKMSQAPETAAEVAASAREEPLTRPTATGESDESGVGSEQTCVDLPDLKGMLPQELQELAIELGERLAAICYPSINHFFFTSGGGESTDSSIKMSRAYWKLRGKSDKTCLLDSVERML